MKNLGFLSKLLFNFIAPIVGFTCLYFAFPIHKWEVKKIDSWEKTLAQITKVKDIGDDKFLPTFTYLVKKDTLDIEFYPASSKWKNSTHKKMPILYNPKKPFKFNLYSFGGLFFLSTFMICFGLIFTALFLWHIWFHYFYFKRKLNTRNL